MTVVIILAFLFFVAYGLAWAHDEHGLLMKRPSRHERCLQNISRLERELFPAWFPEPLPPPTKVEWLELEPGARWEVEDPRQLIFWDPDAEREYYESLGALAHAHKQVLVRQFMGYS